MKMNYLIKAFISFLLFFTHSNLCSQQGIIDAFEEKTEAISKKYLTNADSAILLFNQLLNTDEVKKDTQKITQVLIAIGKEYISKKKDIAKAMLFYNQSLVLAQKSGDCDAEIRALIFLCTGYHLLKKMDAFFQNYEKAALVCQHCPQSKRGVYIHTQLGLNYLEAGDSLRGEIHLLKADSIIKYQEGIEDDEKQFAYSCLVRFYRSKNDLPKMMHFAQKAKAIIHKSNRDDLFDYVFIIEVFQTIGDLDSALYYAHYLENLPKENYDAEDNDAIRSATNMLADIYASKGDLHKALVYKNKYVLSLESLANARQTDDALSKTQVLENELALVKQQRQIDRNQWIMLTLGCIALGVLIFLSIVYYNFQKQKKLNALLENQKQELTALNEIRTKMFSVLSHDLVSPLGALQNMVELHDKGIISQEDFKDYTGDLKYHIDALLKTIKSILDWSFTQLDGKKPFIEPLDIPKIVAEQLDLQRETARQKNILLTNHVTENFKISADFNQMNLIVRNLLDNALKYTPQGGEIDINAFDTEGGKILEFKDTGIGMSTEKAQNLFNFSNKDKKVNSSKNKDVGLGLQMVGDLLNGNNCTISVVSIENEGSVFSLLFKA
jgi:signal transduction histidine kinase